MNAYKEYKEAIKYIKHLHERIGDVGYAEEYGRAFGKRIEESIEFLQNNAYRFIGDKTKEARAKIKECPTEEHEVNELPDYGHWTEKV